MSRVHVCDTTTASTHCEGHVADGSKSFLVTGTGSYGTPALERTVPSISKHPCLEGMRSNLLSTEPSAALGI